MEHEKFVQIITTTDRRDHAEAISRALVEMRLAACVQVLGPLTSTYRWQGRIETAEEWQCLIKSRRDRCDDVTAVIRTLHPYDVPEIIVVPIVGGQADYLHWLDTEVEPALP